MNCSTISLNIKVKFILLSLFFPGGTMALAPSSGVVVEGLSVPGATLGYTRAQIESVYGPPKYCQSLSAGDYRNCFFNIRDGGQVSIRYSGPDGGNSSNSPTDIVTQFSWSNAPHWETTTGVTVETALSAPESLLQAYPNAEVTRDSNGTIKVVTDYNLGITIRRSFIQYSGGVISVSIDIFNPTTNSVIASPDRYSNQ